MLVQDLMASDLITITPEDSLETAMSHMVTHRIRELPVLDDGVLAGILTERDLKMALGPDSRGMNLDAVDPRQLSGSVEWFMSRSVETIRASESLGTATDKLLELRVGSLPVLDDSGALVGILSVTDILRQARCHLD